MAKVSLIHGRQIIDSRGYPTLETEVVLDNGLKAKAAVPSGASTGTHEALELRDGDPDLFFGKSVYKAVAHVNNEIALLLKGREVGDQEAIDRLMLEKDGTANKAKLGANAILSVSLAVARVAALETELPLYEYLNRLYGKKPETGQVKPLFNVINGGLHANGGVSIQEFFLIPQNENFADNLRSGCELYHELKNKLVGLHMNTNVGDEGGFAPHFDSNSAVLELLASLVENKNTALGLDVASSTFYENGSYKPENSMLSKKDYIQYISGIAERFSLKVLEDPFFEDDWDSWVEFQKLAGNSLKLIGDDLLVTNPTRLKTAVGKKACNGILVKVNQIGSLTETLRVIKEAREAGFTVIVSHRSGETSDDFISDLSVGVGADYVKFGAPARGERVAKYNRLLEIYESQVK